MKRIVMSAIVVLYLGLTGCSAAAFWLSGCGSPEADVVIVNDSGREVWSITLHYENSSQTVRSAQDHALLERGQSYGLELEENAVTVTLSGRYGRELARRTVDFAGERLYLTLEEDGGLSVSEEWSYG